MRLRALILEVWQIIRDTLAMVGVLALIATGVSSWILAKYKQEEIEYVSRLPHLKTRGDLVSLAFGGCGDPCYVRHSPGGDQNLFAHAAQDVLNGARGLVIIDGICASACVVFADKASDRVCITPRARFGFHLAARNHYPTPKVPLMAGEVVQPVTIYYKLDVGEELTEWVNANGGFPAENMKWMEYKDAKDFWETCDKDGNILGDPETPDVSPFPELPTPNTRASAG